MISHQGTKNYDHRMFGCGVIAWKGPKHGGTERTDGRKKRHIELGVSWSNNQIINVFHGHYKNSLYMDLSLIGIHLNFTLRPEFHI